MEYKIFEKRENIIDIENISDDKQRLAALISFNENTRNLATINPYYVNNCENQILENPISTQKAFAKFGRILGTLVPIVLFLKSYLLIGFKINNGELTTYLCFTIGMTLVCSFVGRGVGQLVGIWVEKIGEKKKITSIILSPFFGIFWGILTGGAGGALCFLFGAIPGAFIAAIVGMITFPLFAIYYELLKVNGEIERKYLNPAVYGIAMIVSALILGFQIR